MNKYLIIILALVIAVFAAVSCDAAEKNGAETTVPAESGDTPSNMPALSGSDDTGDPSANLPVEITGIVKEIKEGLVLVEIPDDGGDFMLRFSEKSEWDAGINTEIAVGNKIICIVKPEPTLTTPSQGEVIRIINNDSAE